jgi:small multidrug resistance pump
MIGPFADRLFRIAFALAGCYNLAFGLWAAIWPIAFFQLFEIPSPRYSGIWACLGMVVGLYGLLYLHAAWKLEAAWPIIAVGLLGKVLGPIGMITSFGDDWPRRLGMICIFNDLIWWLPFGLFLIRGTLFGKWIGSIAPWLCVAIHAAALLMMAVYLRAATLIEPDIAVRATYIASHATTWTIGWSMWILAAISLVGFYAWWGSHVTSQQTSLSADRRRTIAILAVVITAFGMVCDFSGEGSLILLLVDGLTHRADSSLSTLELARAANIERAFTLLSAGAANGLYTVGGIMLTLITTGLPRWVRAAMWITWFAGIGMTIATIANSTPGMVATTAVLFPPFLVWVAWMGARWPAVSLSARSRS